MKQLPLIYEQISTKISLSLENKYRGGMLQDVDKK